MRLFRNATFHTGDWTAPPIGGLLTDGERVVALGDPEDLRRQAGSSVVEVDLAGGVAIPGLVDAHLHTAHCAAELTSVDLRATRSLTEAVQRVATFAAALSEDAWVTGGNWNHNRWDRPVQPDRHSLDRVTGGRPAALPSIDGHTTWANTAALDLVGIDARTPDPAGGEIVRDPGGNPTGILRERAAHPVRALAEAAGTTDLPGALARVQQRLLAVGLVGVHCFDDGACERAWRTLRDRGEMAVRVHKSIPVTDLAAAVAAGRRTGDGDHWLSTGAVKLFADGALGSHSCQLSTPFPGGGHGIEVTSAAELAELADTAARAGIAVATHAIGDLANTVVLDAYQALADRWPDSRLRHRIEHTQHLQPADVARLARLGVVASMQPTHCTSDHALAGELLGGRGLANYAWRSVLDAGGRLALGSDAPVELPDPMHGIHAAVTRRDADGCPPEGFEPAERITVTEAIDGFTTGPAYASGQERITGRLAPGMLADLTVLAEDPTRVAAQDLRDLPVTATVVGGEVRHRS